ncbi:MAG: alkaline phosphatase, partial [Phycisphaerales bacterium]|nr:alkaline phosphatase [Phycisphaerales bacterium]
AYGLKVPYRSYGLNGETPIVDEKGQSLSVARQAMRRGLSVALINSGTSTEPGTGCFLASVTARSNHDDIMAQLVESGADILMGGGEGWTLPVGVQGHYGPGLRKDGRNLIEEARKAGYTVVFNRDELLALPSSTNKVFGVFAHNQTFNDVTEETLAEKNLPAYWPYAPTIGEMTQVALRILEAKNRPFFAMIEEEGTDNFANNNNARDTLLALKRADDAIGLAREYISKHPHTLIMVTADSNAGAMHMLSVKVDKDGNPPAKVDKADRNGAAYDGINGTETAPFIAQPDRAGVRLPFVVVWGTLNDAAGGVLVRAEGLNAELVQGSFDNTKVAELIRLTLFGTTKP